jgi:DNA-binding CsgD family transcriptional regulator/tetratricopeptide (TPR) repeat protein
VLVERGAHLALLGRIADRAAAGEGQLAVVTGEAGAGKSRLTHEFATSLADGWQMLFVRAEAGATNPFGDLVGEVAAGDAPAGAIGSALGRAVALRAGAATLLMIVEDLERADPVLISALASALDVLTAVPTLILATFRLGGHSQVGEQTAALAEVLRGPSAHEVKLESLSREGVIEMATAMGRHLSDSEAGDLHERGDGNPFFVEELLNSPSGKLPWTITESIMRRLEILPASALEVAQAMACAFDPVPRHVIEDIVKDGGAGAIALLDAGVAVTAPADQISLRHALVCEVVAAQLTAKDRREWHRLLAEQLEQQPDISAARLARHWRDAGDAGRAARWAVIAADEAASGRAYRTATELYRVALSMPTGDELEQAELFDRAAVAAASAGLGKDAFEWASSADARYRGAGQQWRAIAMWLNPALPYVPKPVLDHRTLAADAIPRLVVEAFEATRRGELDEAVQLARRAVELGDDRSDLGVLQTAAAARRLISAGQLDEGEEILLRLRASAAASQNRPLLSRVMGQQSLLAASRGEITDCLMLNRQALALAQDGEQGVWGFESGIALILAYLGGLDEATELVSGLLATRNPIIVDVVQLPACVIDLERADLASARERLERLQAVHALGVADYTVMVLAARARWHQLSNEHEQALDDLAEARAVTGDLFEPSRVETLALALRSARALDDHATEDRTRRALDQAVELGGGRDFQAAATWAHALAAARDGVSADAATLLASAAETFERAGRFIHAAEAWFDLADLAVAMGDDPIRQRAITRACEIAEPRRLTSVLGRLRDHAETDDRRDLAGPLRSLSSREREIAELVVAGKTNREIAAVLFVSEHTVRNQLVNVFAKLGISRRTELARLALGTAPVHHEQTGQPDRP